MTSMYNRRIIAARVGLLILLLAAFLGCGQEAEAPATAVAEKSVTAEDIPWFEGTVEEAFALAKEERRPLFLYWGAEWCPPCHALRSRLFSQPEFQARLSAAIPVYLDGDTTRAQIWGEKLGTAGYPTVIIFNADGEEITRIPGTLPIEQYAEVLSDALDATRSITAVLAAAEADGIAAIPEAEVNLLAFYSYGQDRALNLDLVRRRELFERFWRETPSALAVEKARFFSHYVWALVDEEEGVPTPTLTGDERDEIVVELEAIFEDRTLRNANLDLSLYGASDCIPFVTPEAGELRDKLTVAWNQAMAAIEDDERLSIDDRLTALVPQLEMVKIEMGDDAEVPVDLQDRIRERIEWASKSVRDEDEMQAVMSTMAYLLEEAGLESEAETLLTEKMSETTAPYYYMGWLAGLEAQSGNEEKAVALYRDAWLAAKASGSGSTMSAFRWGSSYLRQAMKYAPESVDAIAADSGTIIGDLLSGPDAFSGGNWSRLEGVGTALEKWQDEASTVRGPVVDSVKDLVHGSCESFQDEGPDSGGGRCRGFLVEDETQKG